VFAGGAAKVERFIGGRVMAHPRQDVELHTVYNFVPGCQRESAGIRVREYGPGGVAAARPALRRRKGFAFR
jgi:hypothetical protein